MSYPPPQQHHVQVQQPVVDKSKRFLNLSGGALMAVITGVIVVCCVGPVALCVLTPMFGAVMGGGPKVTPQAEVTGCMVLQSTAVVVVKVTNPGGTAESFTVKLEVRDATGSPVGTGSARISDIPGGKSKTDSTSVRLNADGGKTCHVVGAE